MKDEVGGKRVQSGEIPGRLRVCWVPLTLWSPISKKRGAEKPTYAKARRKVEEKAVPLFPSAGSATNSRRERNFSLHVEPYYWNRKLVSQKHSLSFNLYREKEKQAVKTEIISIKGKLRRARRRGTGGRKY